MKTTTKIKTIPTILFVLLAIQTGLAQAKTVDVDTFDKVIVSPHIQVVFQQGDSESVSLESSTEPEDKINIEVNGKTLRIYLDGARDVTKSEKPNQNGYEQRKSIYNGTVVKATVTYKQVEELSLRGEENIVCKSTLEGDKFNLTIYGASQVYLNSVDIGRLKTTIYGASYLEIKEGTIGRHKITAYGETKINTLGVDSKSAKIIAYGEGSYRLKVNDDLKVTAYGEATVTYEGNPKVNKGIIIGEATVRKIQ
ncbi:Putative auto-transporter adhesin, head GIN domain [Pricia antarctica]|uniref:Putative auto-transporter adhesin, head GIN domain n=1 Tax=Pricia antarctica TaxID=641691 RepID=A0A1G6W166_9FLAO|nr:head GIN domain-containing protein [Pricia antarctica]SDD58977.1 Putative auto-transporter adhesin, head GIN domain [Pricia antarctica]